MYVKEKSKEAKVRLYLLNVSDPAFQATAFSLSYSDSGLFGIYTVTQAGSAREVINGSRDHTQPCPSL